MCVTKLPIFKIFGPKMVAAKMCVSEMPVFEMCAPLGFTGAQKLGTDGSNGSKEACEPEGMRTIGMHRGTKAPPGWFDWVQKKPVNLKTHRRSLQKEALQAVRADIRPNLRNPSDAYRRNGGDEAYAALPSAEVNGGPGGSGNSRWQPDEFRSRRPFQFERGSDRGGEREPLSKYGRGADRGHQRERQADSGRTQRRDSQSWSRGGDSFLVIIFCY